MYFTVSHSGNLSACAFISSAICNCSIFIGFFVCASSVPSSLSISYKYVYFCYCLSSLLHQEKIFPSFKNRNVDGGTHHKCLPAFMVSLIRTRANHAFRLMSRVICFGGCHLATFKLCYRI